MANPYFAFTRKEIEPLLPFDAHRIVDVGCGAGNTSAWLKSKFPKAQFIGVEANPELRAELEATMDEIHTVDLNREIPDVGNADLILFLDVLEHLSSPLQVLKAMLKDMPEHGHVIASLPNIAHFSVSGPLFFRGQFDYKDAGILDRTHLRFYVRETVVELMNEAGLLVIKGLESGLSGTRFASCRQSDIWLVSGPNSQSNTSYYPEKCHGHRRRVR